MFFILMYDYTLRSVNNRFGCSQGSQVDYKLQTRLNFSRLIFTTRFLSPEYARLLNKIMERLRFNPGVT